MVLPVADTEVGLKPVVHEDQAKNLFITFWLWLQIQN